MHRLTVLLFAVLVLALASCGSDEEPSGGGGRSTPAADADAFPVSLKTKFGTTTVETAPERVAVVGLREQDDLLALGIVPVLTSRFAGEKTGIQSWAKASLDGAEEPPSIETTDGIPVERVAASRPDLIVARFSGMTKDEYEQLSKIAPVLAQPADYADYGEPWQEEMVAVGAAVGQKAKAQELVDAAEAKITAAREDHPEFEQDRTGLVATTYQGVYVYGPDDPRGRLLDDLGFAAPEGIDGVVPTDSFGAQLSEEKLDLLDVDGLIWLNAEADGDKLPGKAIYDRLGVSKRAIFAPSGDLLYNAMSAVTVLNVEPILDALVPKLARAVRQEG